MDPNVLDSAACDRFFSVILNIVFFMVFNVTGALSFLTGHAIVPSLVTSNHIPANVSIVRPVLYVIAVIAWVLAWFFFYQMVIGAINTISPIYPRFTF